MYLHSSQSDHSSVQIVAKLVKTTIYSFNRRYLEHKSIFQFKGQFFNLSHKDIEKKRKIRCEIAAEKKMRVV